MKKILVLYYSRHGAIAELAKSVAIGVEQNAGCQAVIRTVPPVSTVCEAVADSIPQTGDIYASLDDLENCDGLILGSPTRFGSVASPIKYFFDQSAPQWLEGTLKDKPAGVFTSSSSLHGGQESTLLAMMLPLIHHGMIIIGIPFHDSPLAGTQSGGTPYGASHVAGADNNRPISKEESVTAEILGRRIANCAAAVSGKAL
jgi:NAD(P)H dehydrogenase (quinone)